MKKKEINQDKFQVLRMLSKKKDCTQRQLAEDLGFSLGKLNYCIKALKDKGLIKIKNFQKNDKKFDYLYLVTPKGISIKTKLTINFMKQKMEEYDDLKKEINYIKK
jgi:EPS-associated MarR family transcriptional regulator